MRGCLYSLVAVGALGLAQAASAATLTATFNNVGPYNSVSASTDGAANFSGFASGLMNWTKTGGDYAGVNGNFTTFCIELTEHVSNGGSYTYNIVSTDLAPTSLGGMGLAKAAELSELFGRFYAGLDFDNSDDMTAMQLSVWNIVYDGDHTLAAGPFQVSNGGAYFGLAQSMLGALDGTGPHASLLAMAAVGVQDQIIPEPASLVLLAAGLLLGRPRR